MSISSYSPSLRNFAITLLLIASSQQLLAKPPATAPTTIIVDHVSIVDVKAGRLLLDQNVTIRDERIIRIAPSGKQKPLPGAKLIHGKGLFLMPALIDSHVHFNNPEMDSRMFIANGVALVREMGGVLAERLSDRNRAKKGDFLGLEIVTVGTILDGNPPYHPWSKACGTVEEGRSAVRELKAAGVDQIKVYSLLKPEVHRAICEEAKRLGLTVTGHVPDSLTLDQAVANGQKGVEHLSGYPSLFKDLLPNFKPAPGEFESGVWKQYPQVDKSILHRRLEKLAATGTVQCPTLILHAGQARILDASATSLWNDYALPEDRRNWSQIPPQYAEYGRTQATAFSSMLETVHEMHRAGVSLVVGTDLGNPGILAGFGVHQEMQFWQKAGLDPAAILYSATLAPARFLGVSSRLGSVETGKTASLALTRLNPLKDIHNASEIAGVFVRGKYFDRTGLDRLLSEAREIVRNRTPDEGRTVKWEISGEVVARGRYNLLYDKYSDGAEDFLITKTDQGYRYMGLRRQPGFGRSPLSQSSEWSRNQTPIQGSLESFTLLPSVQQYRMKNTRLNSSVSLKGKIVNEFNFSFPIASVIQSPLLSADYFLYANLKMTVGESRRIQSVHFSGAKDKPLPQTLEVNRLPDETVSIARNRSIQCLRYTLKVLGNSSNQIEVWVGENGLPIKQVISEGSLKRTAILEASLQAK